MDQASATVSERLNGLLDHKLNETEKNKFDIPENPQKSEIEIHFNFKLIMSPAFANHFDVIVLEDQMEFITEEKKKELIKFLLINSYKENRIKEIISKQEEAQQNENEELLNIDFDFQFEEFHEDDNFIFENDDENQDFFFDEVNESQENDNRPKEKDQEKEIEETYTPSNELINLVYAKSDDFETIYKLNQFCRTIRIFILYFKEKKNINQDCIVNFCYNLLAKDFEKGKLIKIAPEIEEILLDLPQEPDNDDPKYFYQSSYSLRKYIAILHACKIANIHLCIYGPPGVGKTSGIRSFGRIISKDPSKRFDFEMYSFHEGTKPSHYYGTPKLKEGKIYYKNGALTNSIINGYMFMADILNLSSISNMNALAPALEMNLNNNINFPGIEKPILIHPNFFFVVCQNEVGIKGRNALPPNIIRRFKKIFYPSLEVVDIVEICREINNDLYRPGEKKIISDEQAERLGEYMIKLNSNNFSEIPKWSLRDIKKLFQRQIHQSKYLALFKGITLCHNILFYTMDSISKKDIPNVKEKVIKIIQKVFDLCWDDMNFLNECFNSKAELNYDIYNYQYIFKGFCSISFGVFKAMFITGDKSNIEENRISKMTSLLEDLFKIGLASFEEHILLIGPSGYTTFLAQKFLSNAKIITLNQDSSVEKLLGSSSFSKSEANDFYLKLIALICRVNNYKDLSQKLKNGVLKEEEIDEIIINKRCVIPNSFIYSLERCKDKIFNKRREDDKSNPLSNMIIEFKPGLILTAILGGSRIIFTNIYNLPTIILERFNEIFSGKCNITINEDTSNTITHENNKDLYEFNRNFRVFGTCSPGSTSQLSEEIISRFSLIYVGEYPLDEQKAFIESYCDLNNLNINTDDNINIDFSFNK